MNNIPKKLRKEMAADPFYSACCVTGKKGTRGDRIEWHHNMIFAGKQVQKAFAILPVRQSVHARVWNPEIKDKMDWVMLNRMTEEELVAFSRAIDYRWRRDYLNLEYGPYTPHLMRAFVCAGGSAGLTIAYA